MSVSLTPEAEADLAEAYAWYQRRRRGLGDEFLQSVDAALAAIQHLPESYPLVHHDNRRVLVRRFPYALFYQAMGGEILVVGCFHAARNPEGWRAGD